ncbi:MAG: penicillin acylase family protein, partial [Chloroflexota bacterium]
SEYVKSDLLYRTVAIDRIAAAEVDHLDEQTRCIIEAFVGGINRQIQVCAQDLPVEFDVLGYAPHPFAVVDVLAILRGMWWSLNGRLENLVVAEAARLLPDDALRDAYLTPEAPEERIVPPGSPYPTADLPFPAPNDPLAGLTGLEGMSDATGSNNWAVAGRRTASGQAILCGDPHQPFWLPSSWYEYALHGPDDDAAGAGHPGVPGLWWGANGDIAWGVTNNGASTRDLYVEEVHPGNPRQYRDGDTWRTFAQRTVEIAVRGQAPQRFTIRSTVRGPIMNDVLPPVDAAGDPPLALRWVGQEHLDDVRALMAVGRARDWPTFRNALRDWTVPVFNFGYTDRTGRVGYQCAGRVPVRGRVVRGFRQANIPADRWQGYVPFDALPRLEDPPRGYVASANNRVAPDDYPYPLHGAWAAGHRATRLKQGLESSAAMTREQMVALQNDVKSCRAERLCPALVRRLAGDAHAEDVDVRLLGDALRQWDYRYMPESVAPVLFESFMRLWQERVAAERFPERLVPLVKGQSGPAAHLIDADDLSWFSDGAPARDAALRQAAREAVAEVRRRFGDDPAGWRWERIHQAHWRHALSNPATAPAFDVGPASVDGCADTVRNTGLSASFGANSGAEYRLVVDFAEPEHFWAVQNAGNSGQPGSPHYVDQFAPWLAGAYHVVHLRRADVERDREGKTVLDPQP